MNIGIVGGDLRTAHLAKMLRANENEVYLVGFENCEELKRFFL